MILLQINELSNWFSLPSVGILVRLLLNLLTVTILVRLVYYRHYQRTDLFLTFFGFNLVIFFITHLLNQVQMSMGAAFGLFAVFSMLRYRTEGISAKDMTYLFIVISLGLISALTTQTPALLLAHALIVLTVVSLENGWLVKPQRSKVVQYDKIELIAPSRHPELLEDLRARTGLDVYRFEIQNIDFLKDSAQLIVFYRP